MSATPSRRGPPRRSPGSSSSCPRTTPRARSSGPTPTSPTSLIDRIILVDDVSGDETVDIARQLGLDVIIHAQNRGYGGNQKTCYDAALEAGADIVVMLHPDYQYDATRIPALVEPIAADERDLMLGSRFLGDPLAGGMPTWKYVEQPVPDDRRERRVRAPPVRVPHRAARLQPASARDDPVPRQQRRLRVRPGAHRPGGGGRDARPHRRDRRADPLLRGGQLGRACGAASCTGCRPCGWSPAICSTASGFGRRRS